MAELNYDILPYGDSAYLVQFKGDGYSQPVVDHIHSVLDILRPQGHWQELVPGYDSFLACFSALDLDPNQARKLIVKALKQPTNRDSTQHRTKEIPVFYGGEYGPDMDIICKSSGLSEQAVIDLHTKTPYQVCMMGFIPGFTFLSPAPKPLHHRRKDTPRGKVNAGSVGIAGWQTGIYGLDSPGGWQIIGRTPLAIFDAYRDNPFLIKAGDYVKFFSAKPEDFA